MVTGKEKVHEAIHRLRNSYGMIGKKTGLPYLAIVFPPSDEYEVLREWHFQMDTFQEEFHCIPIDVVKCSQKVLNYVGIEKVRETFHDETLVQNAKRDLGVMWIREIGKEIKRGYSSDTEKKVVFSIERTGGLYPVTNPYVMMEQLWNDNSITLDHPLIVFIPGSITGSRHYNFLDRDELLMYHGDMI